MVLKRHYKKSILRSLRRSQNGQISVFFAVVTFLIISFLAFTLNVGTFVHAKINLQNAVDAAAWSGAAVQARQLTKIANLNWALKSIYKELIYKYYIVGTLGAMNGKTINENVDYRPRNNPLSNNPNADDRLNVPSVCVQVSPDPKAKNICAIASVPGLPRFSQGDVDDIGQMVSALTDRLVKEKASNCADRTIINYVTLFNWIYASKNPSADPAVADSKTSFKGFFNQNGGAYPNAIELTYRIRNQEFVVNKKPKNSQNQDNIMALDQRDPGNERLIKAYMSAYRNLIDNPSEPMKQEFTLSELAPNETLEPVESHPSRKYIPPALIQSNPKYYLDLRLYSLNLGLLYSSFTADLDQIEGTAAEGACKVAKMVIPIPQYPLGFEKNPQVMTYYAVKGETSYIGLFNPFKGKNLGLKMKAYASAKPFGGKIGPYLFKVKSSGIYPRKDPNKSFFYAASLGNMGSPGGNNLPGTVPDDVWPTDGEPVIGGSAPEGKNPLYVIPNFIHDYYGNFSGASEAIQNIGFQESKTSTKEAGGMYDQKQYEKLSRLIPQNGGLIQPGGITQAIEKAKAPTEYDFNNYLVPYPTSSSDIYGKQYEIREEQNRVNYNIYVPLVGEYYLFREPSALLQTYEQTAQVELDKSIAAFVLKLKDYADTIGAKASGRFCDAARKVHYGTDPSACPDTGSINKCDTIAGKMEAFFAKTSECESVKKTFGQLLTEAWSDQANPTLGSYFSGSYMISDKYKISEAFKAYAPTKRTGARKLGEITHPFNKELELAYRNFYSTKFIQLKTLTKGSELWGRSNFSMIGEESSEVSKNDFKGSESYAGFKNALEPSDVPKDIKF